MKKNALVVVLLLIFAWGCSTLHPEQARRFKDAQWEHTGENLVTVSAFTLDAPADKPKDLILQLAPQGQAALIYETGEKTKDVPAKEFMAELAGPIDHKATDVVWDKTAFKKRIVFAVEKTSGLRGDKPIVGPADRINELKVTLDMRGLKDPCSRKAYPNDAEFISWDRFDTKYDYVDLGKVTRTHGSSAELGMTAGLVSVPVGANAKISETRSLQEETPLKQRYIVISGHIEPDGQKAVLRQEGQVGIDLTGTFSVDFDIRVSHEEAKSWRVVVIGPLIKEGKEGKGAPVDPGDVKIDFARVKFRETADPIKCRLSYDYTLRHVVGEERELTEGLQSVIYMGGSGTAEGSPDGLVNLVDYRDMQASVYTIAVGPVRHGNGDMLTLMGDQNDILYFPSYSSAKDFLRWLKTKRSLTITEKNFKLGITGWEYKKNEHGEWGWSTVEPRPLKPEEIDRLIIHAEVLNPDKKDIEKGPCGGGRQEDET